MQLYKMTTYLLIININNYAFCILILHICNTWIGYIITRYLAIILSYYVDIVAIVLTSD